MLLDAQSQRGLTPEQPHAEREWRTRVKREEEGGLAPQAGNVPARCTRRAAPRRISVAALELSLYTVAASLECQWFVVELGNSNPGINLTRESVLSLSSPHPGHKVDL